MPNRFTGTNPDPVDVDSDLEIHYSNPALANTTVTIDINNGFEEDDSIEIVLDATGSGVATWHVPASGWTLVNLNGPDSTEKTVSVNPPD